MLEARVSKLSMNSGNKLFCELQISATRLGFALTTRSFSSVTKTAHGSSEIILNAMVAAVYAELMKERMDDTTNSG
jgi:hypothetical protein